MLFVASVGMTKIFAGPVMSVCGAGRDDGSFGRLKTAATIKKKPTLWASAFSWCGASA